jgi:ABC-2 type transport system permease protein
MLPRPDMASNTGAVAEVSRNMRNVTPVVQRELNADFYSPIAYAVLTVFLVITGIFFLATTFTPGGESSIRNMVEVLTVLLVIILPLLTMRLLSEEFKSGTIETLMTAPVSEADVIVGKFLGAFVFYMVMLATTLVYAVIVAIFGELDIGLLVATYLGLLLLGGLYIAVGLFFSACTKNQIIAAVFSVVLLMVFTFLAPWLATKLRGLLGICMHHLSIREHADDFGRGLVDTNHLIFFVTSTGMFLFLAVKVLESRRWR